MVSKLCCATAQESRSSSPDLPNSRVSEATPAKRPLLPATAASPGSRFTSARTEELHELKQIFDNAKDRETHQASPAKARRARFSRSSTYSLHGLHKMQSMHSIIKRKFSKDLSKQPSGSRLRDGDAKDRVAADDPDTVVKQSREGPRPQLNITKANLRRDLFSDKKPDEGGYDSDAQVMDDIAKNIGKKTPSQRPSIHSIDWSPSTGSKPTASSSNSCHNADALGDIQPYFIKRSQATSLSARFTQVFSVPNFRAGTLQTGDGKRLRSYSASSVELPTPSLISPTRLPSLKMNDNDGVPWSVSMTESLRLSQFPDPLVGPKSSKPPLGLRAVSRENNPDGQSVLCGSRQPSGGTTRYTPARVEIRVQEPTCMSTPRASSSIRDTFGRGTLVAPTRSLADDMSYTGPEDPRSSVHLHSMRISHHLRSGSLLSWDAVAGAQDPSVPSRPFRERSVSDQSRTSVIRRPLDRQEQTFSSSGFASSRTPSKWATVIEHDPEPREDMSSIYSSRPHSPPDSVGGSMKNTSKVATHEEGCREPGTIGTPLRHSHTYTSEDEETPRPTQRSGLIKPHDTPGSSRSTPKSALSKLKRNNSVATTKKSKFHEEFSPSPPKKLTPSASIINFFKPKRTGMRSQSEANLKSETSEVAVDGSLDVPHAATHPERRVSQSFLSLETEHAALGRGKGADPMWDRALRAYNEERASMFLPQNKDQAALSSPYRFRRGSSVRPVTPTSGATAELSSSKRFTTPVFNPKLPSQAEIEFKPTLFSRRTALFAPEGSLSPEGRAAIAFSQQQDNKETLGAWGRYPSHSRPDRTLSAGHTDSVRTRDFALEAAVRVGWSGNTDMDEDGIDPNTRPLSPDMPPGQKRRKKVGSTRMAKSNSMTFGKNFIKNYTRMFRSQSTEFQRHGHGHRSSITTGGMLEYPELEILPDVWRRGVVEGPKQNESDGEHKVADGDGVNDGDIKGKGKMKMKDSLITLRPTDTGPGESVPAASRDGDHTNDRARKWSVYYEDCVAAFPRASTDFEGEVAAFDARPSHESKRTSLVHSHTIPARTSKHSRNASHMSRLSAISHGSAKPSFASRVDDGDVRSVVSVRRSTMDLLELCKEREVVERERVLSLMRGEGMKSTEALGAL